MGKKRANICLFEIKNKNHMMEKKKTAKRDTATYLKLMMHGYSRVRSDKFS